MIQKFLSHKEVIVQIYRTTVYTYFYRDFGGQSAAHVFRRMENK